MSKLYLFFLYFDFPEIIGTHLVHPCKRMHVLVYAHTQYSSVARR
jgi:hypothetical protein